VIVKATAAEQTVILRAMRSVATVRETQPLAPADEAMLQAAWTYGFAHKEPLDMSTLVPIAAADLPSYCGEPEVRECLLRFAAVTALVDETVDGSKIGIVSEFADALAIHDDYVNDLAETVQGHVDWVVADLLRHNADSLIGVKFDADDIIGTFLPYGKHPDPELAAKYATLEGYPPGTFGRALFEHYHLHGYIFPGSPDALSEHFAIPHDSSHVLSGYSTSPQGELLVATFTAGMHGKDAMEGYILPLIYSWHLGIELNKIAGGSKGAFDPAKFYVALDRGTQTAFDIFSEKFDVWAAAPVPVEDLRRTYGIPPLDPRFAADGELLHNLYLQRAGL
jgi:hypothetical protein